MKSGQCPHCDKKIPMEKLKCLKSKRAIFCPSCSKAVRIRQTNITITVGFFGALAGVLGREFFNVALSEVIIIMAIFAACYSFIYLKFIGLYFPLEKAQDEDLLI
jgi:hypothetical protein